MSIEITFKLLKIIREASKRKGVLLLGSVREEAVKVEEMVTSIP